VARPAEVRFADALPKTRSGKIMRRLLRELAAGGQVGRTDLVLPWEALDAIEALRDAARLDDQAAHAPGTRMGT
jgi:acetyl-CoA synthetase